MLLRPVPQRMSTHMRPSTCRMPMGAAGPSYCCLCCLCLVGRMHKLRLLLCRLLLLPQYGAVVHVNILCDV